MVRNFIRTFIQKKSAAIYACPRNVPNLERFRGRRACTSFKVARLTLDVERSHPRQRRLDSQNRGSGTARHAGSAPLPHSKLGVGR